MNFELHSNIEVEKFGVGTTQKFSLAFFLQLDVPGFTIRGASGGVGTRSLASQLAT